MRWGERFQSGTCRSVESACGGCEVRREADTSTTTSRENSEHVMRVNMSAARGVWLTFILSSTWSDDVCAFALSHPGSREHALYRFSTQTDYLHHSIAAGFALLQTTDITMNEVINRTNTLYNYIYTHINTHSLAQTYKCRVKSISYPSSNKTLVLIFKNHFAKKNQKTSKIRSNN